MDPLHLASHRVDHGHWCTPYIATAFTVKAAETEKAFRKLVHYQHTNKKTINHIHKRVEVSVGVELRYHFPIPGQRPQNQWERMVRL